MEFISQIIPFVGDYLIPFLVALTILVFFHELGHFWVARRNGVKVEVFSIGFGKELFGFNDRHGTRWKFALIPLGGYVKMFGDTDEASTGVDDSVEMTEEEKKVSFHYKSLKQRAAIVAAGPIANFILAIVLYAGVFMFAGQPVGTASVGTVQDGSAAQVAGLEVGDDILTLNGQTLETFEDLRAIVLANPGIAMGASVQRGDELLNLTITPGSRAGEDGIQIGFLGISPDGNKATYISVGPFEAIWMGVEQTYLMTARIIAFIGDLFTGQEDTSNLGGPIKIAEIAGTMSEDGLISVAFVMFLAALSVNLGLINLFPIPVLDGGHLVFYAAEAIKGKPLSEKVQEYGYRVGLGLVLLLMVFATWNDLRSILF